MTTNNFSNSSAIVLDREEVYDPKTQNVWPFKHIDLSKKNLAFLINVETNAIRNVGIFKGQNNIGKILMICRDCIKRGVEPNIDLNLLRSKNIYILGTLPSF